MQPRTGPTLNIAFVTVGNLARQTGGYLYHAHVHDLLRAQGDQVREVVLCDDASWDAQRDCDPLPADEQLRAADVLLIDMLACRAVFDALPQWHARQTVVAMVHELPSVADPNLATQQDITAAEQALLQHADHVVTVSAWNAALLYDRGVAPERVSIAAPGSDRLHLTINATEDGASDDSDSSGDAAGEDASDRVQVLCLAQWIPRKGIDLLVRAWQQAQTSAQERADAAAAAPALMATLHLVGERDADPAYTAQVDALIDGDQTIHVHGVISDQRLHSLWQQIDIFALPSRAEGYGMVYAEALLRGVPVIATDAGPIPEVVGDGGVLVPVDDVDALAAALRQLLDDPVARVNLSDRAAWRGRRLPRWVDTAAALANALATAQLQRNSPTP